MGNGRIFEGVWWLVDVERRVCFCYPDTTISLCCPEERSVDVPP